jgi:hypothetical protein
MSAKAAGYLPLQNMHEALQRRDLAVNRRRASMSTGSKSVPGHLRTNSPSAPTVVRALVDEYASDCPAIVGTKPPFADVRIRTEL